MLADLPAVKSVRCSNPNHHRHQLGASYERNHSLNIIDERKTLRHRLAASSASLVCVDILVFFCSTIVASLTHTSMQSTPYHCLVAHLPLPSSFMLPQMPLLLHIILLSTDPSLPGALEVHARYLISSIITQLSQQLPHCSSAT